MTPRPELQRRILSMVKAVKADPPHFGVLSTGEKCAVALVLDDIELMRVWGTALDCATRLDAEWLDACLRVQRDREFLT